MVMKNYLMVFCFVLVGITGTAYGQYSGDKVPPGTMYDVESGDTIFPPKYVDFYYSDPRFERYQVIAEQYRYDIPYMVSNGIISQMDIDCSNGELVLDMKSSDRQGWITLALPRLLIDSKTDDDKDDNFLVHVDSTEVQRSDIASEKLRLLLIPFSNYTSQVSIIGINDQEYGSKNSCNGMHDPPIFYLLSPLKQSKMGMSYSEITCVGDLALVQKYDSSPACVKPESVPKLTQRGWTEHIQINVHKIP